MKIIHEKLVIAFIWALLGLKKDIKGKTNEELWAKICEEGARKKGKIFILLLVGHSQADYDWVKKYLFGPYGKNVGVLFTNNRFGLHHLVEVSNSKSVHWASHWLPIEDKKGGKKRKREGGKIEGGAGKRKKE